ncbi:urea carboxylase-associated family protein [Mycobacterium frederiksbergense]|uniref:urea amidolyase associated protein UAAP1 n=1 Tax=Mycolicibacterium frederiksbergense TaxID=117567 RepID=UPI0021F263EC|nr:urea amidolyase associated protein UAAP1 [Mycolicibacterium frederiksbergense]MCV7046888.1 urea carboxylase-associated family protein [Mycolicibacterium frederiksbergense]
MSSTDTASETATTAGARAHARAQHGRTAEFMRHIPASSSPTAPAGVPAESLVWSETVAPGGYSSAILARGTRVRFTDPAGDACAHLLLHRADAPHERLNVADTVKVPWQAYLGNGHPLLSGFGRALATIVADTSGTHDALTGTSTRAGNLERYGAAEPESPSPAGRELFTLAALKHGLDRRDLPPSLSFFQGVRVQADGTFDWVGSAGAGTSVELLLHVDAIVLVANTAHPLDPRPEFTCSPLLIHAWPAPADLDRLTDGDLVGPLGPEHRQAIANTDADLTARGQL